MIGRLGGNRRPKLPDDVIRPSENRSGYFSLIRAGYKRPPRAMIVTPEAPVNAVKKAHATNATIANPPGSHPRIAREKLTIRTEARLSARMNPAKVNSGMVYKTGLLANL